MNGLSSKAPARFAGEAQPLAILAVLLQTSVIVCPAPVPQFVFFSVEVLNVSTKPLVHMLISESLRVNMDSRMETGDDFISIFKHGMLLTRIGAVGNIV